MKQYIHKGIHTQYKISIRGYFMNGTGKPISQYKSEHGYKYSVLIIEGRRVKVKIHRAVAITYIGYHDETHDVNHKDGNKNNNHLSNLEFLTHKENIRHSIATGLKQKKNKIIPVICISSEGMKEEYRSIRSASMSKNISVTCIHQCIKGMRKTAGGFIWKHKTLGKKKSHK